MCGNGRCEFGESVATCSADCPVGLQSCPTSNASSTSTGVGLVCGGQGTCLPSSGTCLCFAGYAGPSCDECGPGYVASSLGTCTFLPGALSSCSDGVKNGNELGTDCGGRCSPCTVMTPGRWLSSHVGIVVGGALACVAVVSAWLALLVRRRGRKKRKGVSKLEGQQRRQQAHKLAGDGDSSRRSSQRHESVSTTIVTGDVHGKARSGKVKPGHGGDGEAGRDGVHERPQRNKRGSVVSTVSVMPCVAGGSSWDNSTDDLTSPRRQRVEETLRQQRQHQRHLQERSEQGESDVGDWERRRVEEAVLGDSGGRRAEASRLSTSDTMSGPGSESGGCDVRFTGTTGLHSSSVQLPRGDDDIGTISPTPRRSRAQQTIRQQQRQQQRSSPFSPRTASVGVPGSPSLTHALSNGPPSRGTSGIGSVCHEHCGIRANSVPPSPSVVVEEPFAVSTASTHHVGYSTVASTPVALTPSSVVAMVGSSHAGASFSSSKKESDGDVRSAVVTSASASRRVAGPSRLSLPWNSAAQ